MTNDKNIEDCSNHKKEILGVSDMKVLAEMIGDLHYETLAELLQNLQLKIWDDGNKDLKAKRDKLSRNLLEASYELHKAAWYIKQAWDISKPFMEDKTTLKQ